MTLRSFSPTDLAGEIIAGRRLDEVEARFLADFPTEKTMDLFPGATLIRRTFRGDRVHVCSILNAKSGRCSEDCSYCSQSLSAKTDAPVYSLLPPETMYEHAEASRRGGADRFSLVTSGKALPASEVQSVAKAVSSFPSMGHYCGSLGLLKEKQLGELYAAGMSRYHHNLETSRSFFPKTCSTHSYEERVATVHAARKVGMEVCSGGIFGIGETDRDVIELAIELRSLGVDAIPVNFLMPVSGTRVEQVERIHPLRCLKIISIFRFLVPEAEVIVCGGRENLGELHPMIFLAGASGVMTGNYLTQSGRTPDVDRKLLADLGMESRMSLQG